MDTSPKLFTDRSAALEIITQKASFTRYGIYTAIFWSILLAYSLFWSFRQHQEHALLHGKIQGAAFFEKDMLYRHWATRHGGIYVPVTASTQPNPYLSHIPERDITTDSGKKLTLMNPAYMTRQVFEMAQTEYIGTGRGHITSLKPIRPANGADAWERESLLAFERGVTEVSRVELIDGKRYYRYMKTLIVAQPCLKCHSAQGYREGDVRGGLSVSVDMEPIYAVMNREMRGGYIKHAFIWLLGIGGIGLGTRKLNQKTLSIYGKTLELEHEIEERQVVQESLQKQSCILKEEITAHNCSEEKLRQSNSYLENLINYANAPIVAWDTDLKITRFNKAFGALAGQSGAEVIGSHISVLFPAGQVDGFMELMARTLGGERWEGVEIPICHVNGTISIVLWNSATILAEDGLSPVATIAQGYDVTMLRKAETERQVLEQQFQQAQKLESLGVLAGGIAHDFNNILTVIFGHCSLAKMDNKMVENHIPPIEHAAYRAADLCRQMLTYAGKAEFKQSQVNMRLLVDEMVKMLKTTTRQNAVITTDLSADIPFIMGDASQIRQIVMNLIINAAEAIGEAQGEIHVSLRRTEVKEGQAAKDHLGKMIGPGEYLCLEVADNGCGMDEETKKRLFEPFYTTKFAGRGLGMSAVLGIIAAHGGVLELSSQVAQGTSFKVYLPMQNSHHDGIESQQQSAVGPWQGSGTVLLVEDEEQIIIIARVMLERLGFTVIEASNGREALELYRQNAENIRVVLTDIGLPVMDGYELFGELKKLNPVLPIVISSGFGDTVVTSRIEREDIAGLVAKPYRIEQLQEVLRKVMDSVSPNQA